MNEINSNNLNKLSYGLFVITANCSGRDNGCITNTFLQLTSDPVTFGVALNKNSLTAEMIRESQCFTVSIIAEDADPELIRRFGFRSGRETDKFLGFKDAKRLSNGTFAVTAGTNSYISVHVLVMIDLETHILFLGEPTDCGILSDVPSATYAFYHAVMKYRTPEDNSVKELSKDVSKPAPPAPESVSESPSEMPEVPGDRPDPINSEGNALWQCRVCGNITVESDLTSDYICPVCGQTRDAFVRVNR